MSEYVLCHHGVKGMKWGVRKKRLPESDIASNVRQTKAAYKQAKRESNKSFDKAYNRSIAAWSPIKKHRQANEARWEDALNKMDTAYEAKDAYKKAKKARNTAINSTANKLAKQESIIEKFTYNEATRRKAAKYIVDNNMSVADATKKAKGEAWVNTAIFGAAAVAGTIAYNKLIN